jgi:hypothetical protein
MVGCKAPSSQDCNVPGETLKRAAAPPTSKPDVRRAQARTSLATGIRSLGILAVDITGLLAL